MIIAIDESGDFASYSQRFNFFVAALLDQTNNAIEVKRQQFEIWKNKIPTYKFEKFNEVKGTELSDEELWLFTIDVLLAMPFVKNVQIRLKPSENSIETVQLFKENELKLIELSKEYYKSHHNNKEQTFFERLYKWDKKRNYQHFLKIGLLQSCIAKSLNQAIGYSLVYWANGFDQNLMNINIKMDVDFIRKDLETQFFKELLRQAIRDKTINDPIPMPIELINSNHPFAQKYIVGDSKINLDEMLGKRCNFHESHEHFELQIADILATIISRFYNYNRCADCMGAMAHVLGPTGQVKTHYIMNPSPVPNPHLAFE